MIKEMKKVQIIGPKPYLDECIKALHAAAVVHIESVPVEPGRDLFENLPIEREKLRERERLEKARDRLRNLSALMLPPDSYRPHRVGVDEIPRTLEDLKPVEESVKALNAKKDELTDELAVIGRYEKLLKGFAPIVSRLGGLRNFDIVGLTLERQRSDVARLLEEEVGRITDGKYQIYVKDLDEETIGIVLTYPKDFEGRVRLLLTGKAISEVRLPDEYADMTLLNALKRMEVRKSELPWQIDETERSIRMASEQWYGTVMGLLKAVDDAIDEIGVLTYAAQTRFTFVIEGWVPADMYRPLSEKFSNFFGDKLLIREIGIKEGEEEHIPVFIKNPRLIRPFEVFLAALPPPKYGSVDPTPYVAVFFPAFFGLIVGDIGYGALIFGLALFLRSRFKGQKMFRDIFYVVGVAALAAVFFGFLFGELFGDLGERLGIIHPLVLNRAEALKTMLVFTLGIGVGHVILGLLIGSFNFLSRRKLKEAGAKLSYLFVVVSFLVIIGIVLGYLGKDLLWPSVAAFVISFIILTVMEGILGPIEFIEALGNMLSYVRIMAVGTASVIMALVANKMGSISDNIFIGILIAGAIHVLNLILSILSPSIQSMRLQYVEFFSKFYEGGGKKYLPFRKK